MKIKFTKSASLIENSKEEITKKRRWDRWLYLTILIILGISLFRWLITPVFFDFAHGILLQEKYDVQFTDDVQILEYCVDEDQFVNLGDTLFSYENYSVKTIENKIQIDSIQLVIDHNERKSSIIAIEAQIQKREMFLKALNKRLVYWKSERLRKEKLVFLDVITTNELANVDRSIDEVTYELATIKAELKSLMDEKAKLLQSVLYTNKLSSTSLNLNKNIKFFISPVDGEVDRIIIPEKQVYYKPDKVFSIIKSNFYVRAYIEMDDLEHFEINNDVVVILPYGNKKLQGRVNKIYSVSEEKDEVLNNRKLVENNHGIVIEITPVSTEGWNDLKVSNIPVKVRKGKINL